MTKSKTIFISILLMASAILIQFLMKQSSVKPESELFGFFSGLVFGAGLIIFLQTIFKWKIRNNK